jgi:hypothetical protein
MKRTEMQAPIHPIFLEAIEFAGNDEFWKTRLIYASRNKFPKNFFMKNHMLCFRDQKKDASCTLSNVPEELYKDFTNFIRKYGCISSDMDLKKMNAISKLPSEKKKKIVRTIPEKELYEFILLCEKEWGLNQVQSTSLQECVFFAVRLHGKKAVVFDDNNEIIGIKGMEEDPKTGLYSLTDNCLKNFSVIVRDHEESTELPVKRSQYKCKEEDFEALFQSLAKTRKTINYDDMFGNFRP